MSRPLTIRKPNADELHQLHQWLEQPLLLPRQQRRSHTNPKRERGSDEIK